MPRKALIRTAAFPYHITNRSNNKEQFYLDSHLLWPIFLDTMEELKLQFQCRIHSFVLMSNHYHLFISTPEENIGDVMKFFSREVARRANRSANRINHFFGGRYKWSVITEERYYWNCVKYIFRNPVRAGICDRVEDYSFSSLVQTRDFDWEMVDWFSPDKPRISLDIDWLNTPSSQEVEQAIKKGLRRREFKLPHGKDRRVVVLDATPYKKGTVT